MRVQLLIANPTKRKNTNNAGEIKPIPHALGFLSIRPSTTATNPHTPEAIMSKPPASVLATDKAKAAKNPPKLM